MRGAGAGRAVRSTARLVPSTGACGVLALTLSALLAGCIGGEADHAPTETGFVAGLVIGTGAIQGALVCADANANGRCDRAEAQARSDLAGAYELAVPANAAVPLVAEIIAGSARDAGDGGGAVDLSYRMATPSSRYSTRITPYTTMVQLTGEADYPLAEDEVRSALGLPPRFALDIGAAAAAGSLTQAAAGQVVAALKAAGLALNPSGRDALAQVVGLFPVKPTDLPVLRISTRYAAPVVSREVYVDATYVLFNPLMPGQSVTLNGRIRGRGHSTWGQPKNPYKVQFTDDANFAAIADVLGMKKNRNWALLADYFDRTLMRNKLAFSLANSSVFNEGLKWSPSGAHLEVYLNDEYVGVYLLAEDIRIDPARLNIRTMSPSPAAGEVDGGYIVEVDSRLDCYNAGAINLQHLTPYGTPFCLDKPDEGSITQDQLAWIKNLLDTVEADIFARGNMDRINPVSFADWYLLQELFRNNDAVFFSSDYMWKDTAASAIPADRLLNMGPIWDFDISAGNINYNDNWKTDGCWVSKWITGNPPNWMNRLLDNPVFRDLVLARWKQKRPALAPFINTAIDAYARQLNLPQQRNFAKWPIFGVQLYNYYGFATYADEVAFLRGFLNQRMAWLDMAFASPESFAALCK